MPPVPLTTETGHPRKGVDISRLSCSKPWIRTPLVRKVLAVSVPRRVEGLVVCYSRAVLGQSGAGHFSPIGGGAEGGRSASSDLFFLVPGNDPCFHLRVGEMWWPECERSKG